MHHHVAQLPPHAVIAAMQHGYSCWLEVKYTIKGTDVYAYAREWLCK